MTSERQIIHSEMLCTTVMGFKQEHLLKKIALVYFLSKMIGSADPVLTQWSRHDARDDKKACVSVQRERDDQLFHFSSKLIFWMSCDEKTSRTTVKERDFTTWGIFWTSAMQWRLILRSRYFLRLLVCLSVCLFFVFASLAVFSSSFADAEQVLWMQLSSCCAAVLRAELTMPWLTGSRRLNCGPVPTETPADV